MKAAIRTLGLLLFSILLASGQNTIPPTDDAVRESVRREAAKIELRQKLADAQAAQRRGELSAAAKLYEDALALVDKISTGVEMEHREVVKGIAGTRVALAEQAIRRGDFAEADTHVNRVLKLDPRNEAALAVRQKNEQEKRRAVGMRPSQETLAQIPDLQAQKITAATLVQDAKFLFE